MPERAGSRQEPAGGRGPRSGDRDVAASGSWPAGRPPSTELSLLAAMGHELRTTISTLLGYHELLADGLLGPLTPRAVEAVGRIGGASRELLHMLGGFLELVELETGRLDLVRQDVDLAAFVEQMAAECGLRVGPSTAADDAASAEAEITAYTDPERLRRVIELLVSAAHRALPSSPARLGIRKDDAGMVRIELDGVAPALADVAPPASLPPDHDMDALGVSEGVIARIAVADRIAYGLGFELVRERAGEAARIGIRLRASQRPDEVSPYRD